MFELGMKSQAFGTDLLRQLRAHFEVRVDSRGRPSEMPLLKGEEMVIAGYDQGLGERLIVCESLEDMQELWDNYAQGYALKLHWYAGEDPGFIRVM